MKPKFVITTNTKLTPVTGERFFKFKPQSLTFSIMNTSFGMMKINGEFFPLGSQISVDNGPLIQVSADLQTKGAEIEIKNMTEIDIDFNDPSNNYPGFIPSFTIIETFVNVKRVK